MTLMTADSKYHRCGHCTR